MSQYKLVQFNTLPFQSQFNCWGDHYLNYEYPIDIEAIKIDEQTAYEISSGVTFYISPTDEVSVLKIKPLESMKTKSMERDAQYLPEHYVVKEQPFYKGPGELSVSALQELCEDFQEYAHQQQIIKQQLFKKLEELTTTNKNRKIPYVPPSDREQDNHNLGNSFIC